MTAWGCAGLVATMQLTISGLAAEYLCFLEAPEDTHGDQSTLGSMLWQQDGAVTLAAARGGQPSISMNARQVRCPQATRTLEAVS